ncbi:hypothetical protein HDV57DRAFT_74624 [Trichoderma longibrachiatum]
MKQMTQQLLIPNTLSFFATHSIIVAMVQGITRPAVGVETVPISTTRQVLFGTILPVVETRRKLEGTQDLWITTLLPSQFSTITSPNLLFSSPLYLALIFSIITLFFFLFPPFLLPSSPLTADTICPPARFIHLASLTAIPRRTHANQISSKSNHITRPDQTRPDQTKPNQTRPDQDQTPKAKFPPSPERSPPNIPSSEATTPTTPTRRFLILIHLT